ncbi:MAG: Fur family transcriptional regulator [Synechococcus sp.]
MSKRAHETQSQVLAVLRSHRGPLSAYDVIGELRQVNPKIAPPTVYRALEALSGRGLVHRLESLKAFIACQYDECQHKSIFAICDECGTVEESFAPDLFEELSHVAGQSGFTSTRHVIELHGLCSSCRTGDIPA